MEAGKRNRLKVKRKPKQNQGSPVVHPDLAPQTPEKVDGAEVIIIDEESPRLAPTNTSTTSTSTTASVTEKASSVQDKGEEHVQDKALNALVKVLLAIDEHRKRVPMEMLSDLPPFQPMFVKGSNRPTTVNKVKDDLPPLPRLCPCKLQHKRTLRRTTPERSADLLSTRISTQRDQDAPADQHVLSAQQDQHILDAEEDQHAEQMRAAQQRAEESGKSATPNPPSDVNASVLKRSTPDVDDLHSGRSEKASAGSKHETVAHPLSTSKPTVPVVSPSALFSKFSTMPQNRDDFDEFEETPFPQRLANSTKPGANKPAGGQTSQKRQTGAPPSRSSSVPKRRKTDCARVKAAGAAAATKSTFPARARPTVSSSKMPPVDKFQPHISSFSTKLSSPVSKRSEGFVPCEPGSHGNPPASTSTDSPGGKHKGSRQCNSDANSLTSNSTSKHLQSSEEPNRTGSGASAVGPKHTAEATQDVRMEGGGRKGPGGPTSMKEDSDRIKACPLCQVKFSTVMSQFDIDTHIAVCLSANDEDIVW